MTDLSPNHPAVEAATFAQWNSQRESHWCPYDDVSDVVKDRWRRGTTNALNAALSHLTADDLRNTPAGRALMAEGWDQGVADNERGWEHVYAGHDIDPDDPLAICQTCGTPNPYLEADA